MESDCAAEEIQQARNSSAVLLLRAIMVPKLSDDLRQAIQAGGGSPIALFDPVTNSNYVIVRAEIFDKLKAVAGENEAEAMYPLLADLDPDDWEDAIN